MQAAVASRRRRGESVWHGPAASDESTSGRRPWSRRVPRQLCKHVLPNSEATSPCPARSQPGSRQPHCTSAQHQWRASFTGQARSREDLFIQYASRARHIAHPLFLLPSPASRGGRTSGGSDCPGPVITGGLTGDGRGGREDRRRRWQLAGGSVAGRAVA